jgi:hypothetical protein
LGEHPLRNFRCKPAYQEIQQCGFQAYFDKFVAPYYPAQGVTAPKAALGIAGDLRTYAAGLRDNPDFRVIVNQNDFCWRTSTWLGFRPRLRRKN